MTLKTANGLKLANLEFSNPRNFAWFDNWGPQKQTCCFRVCNEPIGQKIIKKTQTAKMYKQTRTYQAMLIVDGSDGRTYLIGRKDVSTVVLIPATLKGAIHLRSSSPDSNVVRLFHEIQGLLCQHPQIQN